MNCNPPGSTVHGILQARILECTAISSSNYHLYVESNYYTNELIYKTETLTDIEVRLNSCHGKEGGKGMIKGKRKAGMFSQAPPERQR